MAPETLERGPSGRGVDLPGSAWLLAGLASLGVVVAHVIQRTGFAGDGVLARTVARLDVGVAVLLVFAGYVLHRPSVRELIGGRPPAPIRARLGRVAALLGWYWAGLAVALVVTRPDFGARQLLGALATLPPWRSTRVDGFGQGWLIGLVVMAAVLEPFAARLVRRVRAAGVSPLTFWSGAVVAGIVMRCGLIVADRPDGQGPLARLPANLAFLALGAAIAWWAEQPRRGLPPRVLIGAALVGFVVLVVLDVPARAVHGSAAVEIVRHLASVLVAGSCGALVLSPAARRSPRFEWWGLLGVASIVWYQAIAELVLRQYVERRQDQPIGIVLTGAWLPPVVWTVMITAALSVASVVAVRFVGSRRERVSASWALAGIVAGGALLRIVALFTVAPPKPDGGDPLFYHTTANLLAHGRGFPEPLNWIAFGRTIPSALHGPAYPVYLSFFSRFGATSIFDHRMASIVAGTGVVLVAGLIGRRLLGDRAMLLAAALVAVYPNLWIIDGVLFPEGLFVLTSGFVILAALRWMRTRTVRDAVLMGVLIGVAAMVRGEGLFLSALLVAPMVAFTRELAWRRKFVVLTAAAIGVLASLAPWTVRNATTFEAFVSLSTNGDELNVYANCADTYEGKYLGFWLFDCQERIRRVQGEAEGDEAERAKFWRDIGWQYARDNVDQLPKVAAARLGRQWELFRPLQNVEFAPIEGRDKRVALAGLLSYYALVPAAIAGAVTLRRRRLPLLPVAAQFLSVSVTAVYAYGTVRFRAPAELSLCVLAAIGLLPVTRRIGRWWRPLPTDAALHDDSAFVGGAAPRTGRRSPGLRSMLALGGLAALLLAPLRGLMRTPGAPMEEGFMLTFPERVIKGDVPNVDFLHLYGPGSLDALAFVYRLFGVRIEVERLFGFGQHVALVLGLYALLRPWGRALAGISAGLAITLIVTPIGLDALAWTGALALGIWSLVFALRATSESVAGRPGARASAVVAGVLAGVALTFRPDLVVALGLSHLVVWWRRPAWLRAGLIGGIVGLLPMWVHLVRAGIGPSIRGMVLDPVFELRAGRTLPRPPSWDRLDGALQVIAEKFPPWWGLPSLSAPKQLVLWFWLVPAVAIGLLVVAWWTRRRAPGTPATRTLAAGAMFSLGIVQQGFQRPDSAHFAWVSCISLALAPAAAAEIVGRWRPRWRPGRRTITIGAGLLAVYLVVMPFFSLRIYALHVRQSIGQLPPGLVVERNDRRFYLGDIPPWLATKAIIDDLDAALVPGERLLVGPVDLRHTVYSDAIFYYLFPELEPATYFIEMDPGVANAPDSGLAEEVASADWLILTRFWAGWIEPNDSVVFGPDEPNQVVEESFCLVGSYENDLARLYRRCEGGGAPGPYEGPYDPTRDPAVEVRVPVPRRPDGTCTATCLDGGGILG